MKKESNSFAVIMQNFVDLANNPFADSGAYADALTALATACARSTLKKVIDPKNKEKTENGKYILRDKVTDGGMNPLLIRMQADLARDENDLARIVYANDNAFDLVFTNDGEYKQETIDSELAKAAADIGKNNLADGLDLVNDAVVAILDEVQKQREREPEQLVDLERPYTIRRLKRKVWIKETDSKCGYETVETAPIREVFKAIRRAIANSRAVQADPKNGYSYLEDFATDENGESVEIYRRLPKYADLGGAVVDFNGGETGYTVDRETVDSYDSMLSALNLTDRQGTILQYRMQGYGTQAIATRLGVNQSTIENTLKRIQEKAVKEFNLPVSILDAPKVSKSNKKMTAEKKALAEKLLNDGASYATIAAALGVSKMTISRLFANAKQ